jgi:hypothetical protein
LAFVFSRLLLQIVLCDLMGGKTLDVPQGTMALPHRTKYWIVITCEWKPEITGPAGKGRAVSALCVRCVSCVMCVL